MGKKGAPVPVGPNLGVSRDGIRFLDPIQAARNPAPGLERSRRRSTRTRRCPRKRCPAFSSTSTGFERTISFPRRAIVSALLALLKPRTGAVRPAVGDARLRAAGPRVSGVPGDFVACRARLLPQVHGGRAHAADDSQPRAPLDRPSCRSGSGFATSWVSSIDPELLVLALLLHDVGKWRDDDHALESVRMAVEAVERLQLDGDARETVLFLIQHHLRMSLVAFRRDTEDPGDRQGLLGVHRDRRAAQDADADDAGGRGSGQPGDA